MPKIRQTTVYSFEELSPAAKKKAIEAERQALNEYLDVRHITHMFKERLDEYGLPSDDVRWSLSSSQGDGVAFYGTVSLTEYVKANKLEKKYKGILDQLINVSCAIVKSRGFHSYDHYNTMILEMDASSIEDVTPTQERLLKELDEHLQEHIKDISREFEKAGYEEIEYQSSEEMAKDALIDNDAEFDENGKRV